MQPSLVPELLVQSRERSLAFWRDLCGFDLRYERADEGFAYITRGAAHLMLEEQGVGRNWVTAPLDRPLGRGMNLQISVTEIASTVARLWAAGWPLFQDIETKWYRTGDHETGVEQFLVQDPDGYLVRFQASRGTRPPG
ncbi:MAG: bleomycin resistance family protein [Frondihabitans sp.]|nr:bleomycin resistance family protein [Frondihabitans sp.]